MCAPLTGSTKFCVWLTVWCRMAFGKCCGRFMYAPHSSVHTSVFGRRWRCKIGNMSILALVPRRVRNTIPFAGVYPVSTATIAQSSSLGTRPTWFWIIQIEAPSNRVSPTLHGGFLRKKYWRNYTFCPKIKSYTNWPKTFHNPIQNTRYRNQKETKIYELREKGVNPGGDLTSVSKKIYVFWQITMGKIKKAPQAKISVIGTIFIPKIAKKTQKNDQQ